MLQTKAKVLRAQDDVKDWDLVSWFSWFMAEFLRKEIHAGVTKTQTPRSFLPLPHPLLLIFALAPIFRAGKSPKAPRFFFALCSTETLATQASSVLEFCLQCAGVSLAAWWSFVCSVLEFCLQRVILLLVVCTYFFYSFFFCLQCAGDDFFDMLYYVCKEFFLFAVFSLCESGVHRGPPY